MNEIFLFSPIVLDEVGWVSEGLKVICWVSKNSQQFQTKFCEVDNYLEILPQIEMAYLHYKIHLKKNAFSSETVSEKNYSLPAQQNTSKQE